MIDCLVEKLQKLKNAGSLVTSAADESQISNRDVNRDQSRAPPLSSRVEERRWFHYISLLRRILCDVSEYHGDLWSRHARFKQKQPSVWHLGESQHVKHLNTFK